MTLASNALTTVVNYKMINNLDPVDTSQDARIEFFINIVSDRIEKTECDRIFGVASYVQKMMGSGTDKLATRQWPILAVAEVKEDREVLEPRKYAVLSDQGAIKRIELESFFSNGMFPVDEVLNMQYPYRFEPMKPRWPMINHYEIDYTAGYVLPKDENLIAVPPVARTLPFDLEMACCQLINFTMSMTGNEHLNRETIGPLHATYLPAIPAFIFDVLMNYKREVQI